MEFSEKQLEALMSLCNQRELGDPVRDALRLYNNGGWSQAFSARRCGVRENTLSAALVRLRRSHKIIMEGYGNYILDE